MNNAWSSNSNEFYLRETSQNHNDLPKGIYRLDITPRDELYLTQVADKFDLNYKIYGIETNFINRVVKTYNNTTTNLGVLLNGVKGTGKTVTAKQISNEIDIPVIIIHEHYDNMPAFINNLQEDVIIFIDEFEKIYNSNDHNILTIMDGVLDNGYRKLFLLTTNDKHINPNLIQRPGRIRYVKSYEDLSLNAIEEIIDDKLNNNNFKDQLIEFLSKLELITVDIVKSIIDEVNIHDEPPQNFEDVFNIKKSKDLFNVYEINEDENEVLAYENVELSINEYCKPNLVNRDFYIKDDYIGVISKVIDRYNIKIKHHYDDNNDRHLRIIPIDNIHKIFSKKK